MPTEHDAGNGLTTFSAHAFEASNDVLARFDEERSSFAGVIAGTESALDPESAARRFLGQALESAALPSLTAPVSAGATSQFKVISTESVPLTATRMVKFRQMLFDIPVYGSLVSVELGEDNELVCLDSTLGHPEDVDPVASIAPAQAVEAARAAPDGYTPTFAGGVPQLHYYFDKPSNRWRLVYIIEDVPVTLDRSAEQPSDEGAELEPPRFVDFVIDAHDASVRAVLPRTPSLAGEGVEQTGSDSFGEEQTFTAVLRDGGLVLRDPAHNVETYDFGFGDPAADGARLPGVLTANPPAWTPAAVSAHVNAVAVSEFMRTVLMRNNIDDRGGKMASTVNCVVQSASPGPKQWVNAFWNGRQMVYGQVLRESGELRSLAANIDIVAHEIFHGVTDSTSRLEYALQSGALNESYSDIFGTIIANRDEPDPRLWDWLLGEKLLPGDRPFRDLSDPPRFEQPAHMDDFRVLPNTRAGDWGGVHINSGIPNKAAFTLLTSTECDGTLTLTVAEVAAIYYLALTQRLSRTSQFTDARRAAVTSARSLFRHLPPEEQERKIAAVEESFETVGMV